jgi:8-oxo-dGTP pyrophosphatase MutT (NUDIX family)
VREPTGPVAQECVEGYLYARAPLALLIFRRTPARGEIWVPISGKVDPSDRDFESALRRELREETGLVEPRKVFDLDWKVKFRVENGEVWRLQAYGVEVESEYRPTLSSEHEAFAWVSVDEGRRRLHYEDNRAAVDRLVARLDEGSAPNV